MTTETKSIELGTMLECRLAHVKKGGKTGIYFPVKFKSDFGIMAPCQGVQKGDTRILQVEDQNALGYIGQMTEIVEEKPTKAPVAKVEAVDEISRLIIEDFGRIGLPEVYTAKVDMPDYVHMIELSKMYLDQINTQWVRLIHNLTPLKVERDRYYAQIKSLPKGLKLSGTARERMEKAHESLLEGYHTNARRYNESVAQLESMVLSMPGIKLALEFTKSLLDEGVEFETPPCHLFDVYVGTVVPVTGVAEIVAPVIDDPVDPEVPEPVETRNARMWASIKPTWENRMAEIAAFQEALGKGEIGDISHFRGDEFKALASALTDAGAMSQLGELTAALKELEGRYRAAKKAAKAAEEAAIVAEAKAKAEANKKEVEVEPKSTKGTSGKVNSRKSKVAAKGGTAQA